MPIHVRTESGVYIIQPEGHIDADSFQDFTACLNRTIKAKKACKLLLDLSSTEYISSACLRVILDAHKTVLADGGILDICSPNENIIELLDIVHLKRVFTIHRNEFEALDSMID